MGNVNGKIINEKKNPGKKNREEKKERRGATWVGLRPRINTDRKKEEKKKQTRGNYDYER